MDEKTYRLILALLTRHLGKILELATLIQRQRYCAELIELLLEPEERGNRSGAEVLETFHSEMAIKVRGLFGDKAMACMVFGAQSVPDRPRSSCRSRGPAKAPQRQTSKITLYDLWN